MKRVLLITLCVLVASVSAPVTTANPNDEVGPDRVYFDATGHYLGGDFLNFWRAHGGIQTFGYPLTPEFEQNGLTVQYFERHVMEYHPENSADYRILLRRLGAEARDARDLANRWPFEPHENDGSGEYFPVTSQNMKDGFLNYWGSNGGTRIFGYPISTQFRHHGTTVQFTERAIFEFHPDNPSGWRILFERLGAQAAERDGVDTSAQGYDGSTPHYSEDLWYVPEPEPEPEPEARSYGLPSELRIDRLGVRAPFEHLGRTPAGAMADPVGWDNVSWFNEGPRPGEVGNAAVAGHLDRPGGAPAIFWNLNQMRPGDRVTVITEHGETLIFEVTEVEQFHVSNAPNSKIFGRTDSRNMNLITCAGRWDTSMGMYDQRLVVYTTLVSG
jgi:hypothetical protein